MIRFIYVPAKASPKSYPCQYCKKNLKTGELAYEITTADDRIGVHKECLEKLTQLGPDFKDNKSKIKIEEEQRMREEFERIRESYAAYQV